MRSPSPFLPRLVLAGLLLAGTLAPRPASTATATGTMAVTAVVLSFCTVAATPLVFGNYTSVQLDATATIVATCTAGTAYNVALDAGTGAGATTALRAMTDPVSGGLLNYALYRNSTRSSLWGNTVGTDTQPGTGTGLPQTLTVYGRVPASQFPAPGAYADLVTVTLTY